MTISRYLGIPLLAATSLAISMMLLPIQPAGADGRNNASVVPAVSAAG